MSYFPLFYNLEQKSILVIGGGNIAFAKLETLLLYSSNITILAKKFLTETAQFIKNNHLKYKEQKYSSDIINNYDIIIVATDDNNLNKEIAENAIKNFKLVNVVDNPSLSNFIFPAIIKKENLTIAISSNSISPILARLIKNNIIKNILPENFLFLDKFIKENSKKVRSKLSNFQARRIFWQEIFEGNIAEEIYSHNNKKAQSLFDNKLDGFSNNKKATIYFVGAGPGDPELITLKAVRLLSKADVVLYDRLVAQDILDYARKDALKINVGKKKGNHSKDQEEINELLVKYAKEKNIVVRLKGGDTSFFARLTEEIEAIKNLDIEYRIIPGITAASGAISSIGSSLTSRFTNKAVRFLSLYKEYSNEYFKELAKTDDSLVFYMSSFNLTIIIENLIKYGRNLETPIAIIEQATTKYQKNFFANLKTAENFFKDKKFISPSIIIIGDIVKDGEFYKRKEESLNGIFFDELI